MVRLMKKLEWFLDFIQTDLGHLKNAEKQELASQIFYILFIFNLS